MGLGGTRRGGAPLIEKPELLRLESAQLFGNPVGSTEAPTSVTIRIEKIRLKQNEDFFTVTASICKTYNEALKRRSR
jgi:hypothetical protein